MVCENSLLQLFSHLFSPTDDLSWSRAGWVPGKMMGSSGLLWFIETKAMRWSFVVSFYAKERLWKL